jgi:acetyltransferase-like isoleucine patch superfamily enzyme
MRKNLVIFGTSTTAETIYKFVKFHQLFNVIGFAVDNKEFAVFNGLPVYNINDLCLDTSFNKNTDYLFVAIQWNYLNRVRRDVYVRLKSEGFLFANIISPNAIIYGNLKGDNCWISDFVIIDTDTSIGSNTYIKTKAYIAHYCIIEDHCFIGANSLVGGQFKLETKLLSGYQAIFLTV